MTLKLNPGKSTAIVRKKISRPLRWILQNNPFQETWTILDYGSGRGFDAHILRCLGYDVDAYDPNWGPYKIPQKKYDIILCTYVLCILPEKERKKVIQNIKTHLKHGGIAYISVRRDIDTDKPHKGYTQYWVELPDLDHIEENEDFSLYVMEGRYGHY